MDLVCQVYEEGRVIGDARCRRGQTYQLAPVDGPIATSCQLSQYMIPSDPLELQKRPDGTTRSGVVVLNEPLMTTAAPSPSAWRCLHNLGYWQKVKEMMFLAFTEGNSVSEDVLVHEDQQLRLHRSGERLLRNYIARQSLAMSRIAAIPSTVKMQERSNYLSADVIRACGLGVSAAYLRMAPPVQPVPAIPSRLLEMQGRASMTAEDAAALASIAAPRPRDIKDSAIGAMPRVIANSLEELGVIDPVEVVASSVAQAQEVMRLFDHLAEAYRITMLGIRAKEQRLGPLEPGQFPHLKQKSEGKCGPKKPPKNALSNLSIDVTELMESIRASNYDSGELAGLVERVGEDATSSSSAAAAAKSTEGPTYWEYAERSSAVRVFNEVVGLRESKQSQLENSLADAAMMLFANCAERVQIVEKSLFDTRATQEFLTNWFSLAGRQATVASFFARRLRSRCFADMDTIDSTLATLAEQRANLGAEIERIETESNSELSTIRTEQEEALDRLETLAARRQSAVLTRIRAVHKAIEHAARSDSFRSAADNHYADLFERIEGCDKEVAHYAEIAQQVEDLRRFSEELETRTLTQYDHVIAAVHRDIVGASRKVEDTHQQRVTAMKQRMAFGEELVEELEEELRFYVDKGDSYYSERVERQMDIVRGIMSWAEAELRAVEDRQALVATIAHHSVVYLSQGDPT